MTILWPENTAPAPTGWEPLVDADGTRPRGWFTRATGGVHTVVRGYPTWDDAPFRIDPEIRTLDPDPDDDYPHLRGVFDLVYRQYDFPDTGALTNMSAMPGPVTHAYVNLDYCGGWRPATTTIHGVGGENEDEVFAERTLTGAKPASELLTSLLDTPDEQQEQAARWVAAAEAAGIEALVYTDWLTRVWLAPARLGDRVDADALAGSWEALAAADPNPKAGDQVRRWAEEALSQAFTLDLHAEPVLNERGKLGPAWWNEHTPQGLIVLGAVLGYPPPTTHAILWEHYL